MPVGKARQFTFYKSIITRPSGTVGSFWPYAPTLFDYIRRAMPMNAPQSHRNPEVYALSAYVLNLNGLVADNATLDAKALAAIKMPNRDGFVGDPRPDVKNEACTNNCKN
jgi:cytochrome c